MVWSTEIAIYRGLAGHTPKEAARLIHCSEDEWIRWESGTSEMHSAFAELYRMKIRRLMDAAARNAAMLVPKFTRERLGELEFEWPDGSEPIRATNWADLAAKVAERERQLGTQRLQFRTSSTGDSVTPSTKEPLHLGLHSGLPPFVSEEADREQLRQMPKASAPCLATRMAQQSKVKQTPPDSENDSGS